MTDHIMQTEIEQILTVDLTLGILINKPNRDSVESLINKLRKYILRKLYATKFEFLEVNTFLFFSCSFPLAKVEHQEQRKNVVNQVEEIIQNYCHYECSQYSKNIKKNVEIKDITKMIVQLVKSSETSDRNELIQEIEGKAEAIDGRVVQHVSDVLLNSFIAVWDFPEGYEDIIMFPDLILKREISDKEGNIPLKLITENLLILQFGKAYTNSLNPILTSTEKAIGLIDGIIQDSKKIQDIENRMSNKLWRSLRVIFGLLSSTQQVISILLKQLRRISEVKKELIESVKQFNYPPLMDYIMLVDITTNCADYVSRLNTLNDIIKKNYKLLLNTLNKFKDVKNEEFSDVRELSLVFIQTLAEIQLMKFYSDKFRDLAYFQSIPTEVALENIESIDVDSDTILKGVALFKTYQLLNSTIYALRGVDIDIKKGEMAAIVGSSGSGKTTLLNLLSGLDTPNRGAVFLLGRNIDTMSDSDVSMFRRRNMGFIFQYYNLIPQLTVLENVMLPALMINRPKKEAKERAIELITDVGLERFQNQFPIKLSGGQMQRVTIARAMINDPAVLFADEPTGDLDSQTGKIVIDLIRKFSKEKNTAVILVTHDLEMARTCDRIIQIGDGRVISD
ncbi:MAG: ABC transporter ATP-binding protein [Candidatus Heimdallarchaeota archaeon]|nr:ABC transporter ATP-binding protein [Candidatus Heimdallarchaeota archaeon]